MLGRFLRRCLAQSPPPAAGSHPLPVFHFSSFPQLLAASRGAPNVPWDDLRPLGAVEVPGKRRGSAHRASNGSNQIQISLNGFNIPPIEDGNYNQWDGLAGRNICKSWSQLKPHSQEGKWLGQRLGCDRLGRERGRELPKEFCCPQGLVLLKAHPCSFQDFCRSLLGGEGCAGVCFPFSSLECSCLCCEGDRCRLSRPCGGGSKGSHMCPGAWTPAFPVCREVKFVSF